MLLFPVESDSGECSHVAFIDAFLVRLDLTLWKETETKEETPKFTNAIHRLVREQMNYRLEKRPWVSKISFWRIK